MIKDRAVDAALSDYSAVITSLPWSTLTLTRCPASNPASSSHRPASLGFYKHNQKSVDKGKLFNRLGFGKKSLRNEVKRLSREGERTNIRHAEHGTQFSVLGEITSRSGHTVNIATGWIIDHGSSVPRLVTISPH